MKMRGKRKNFGRCSVRGHGGACSVSAEIQSGLVTRGQEKSELIKEMAAGEHGQIVAYSCPQYR